MEDEEDDFYDPADTVAPAHASNNTQDAAPGQHMDDMDDEEEVEVDSDEDDFNIITEAPADAPPPEISHPRHASLRQDSQRPSSADSSAVSKSATPSATPRLDVPTQLPGTGSAAPAKPTVPQNQKPGSSYPAIHTSTIDVNGNPVHPSTGKTIMATDMDTDFPADDKPWRRPGSDVSDFFNYGFDEFTWVSYCLKQRETRKEVGDQKRQMDDMSSFLGMGMPPMPGAPPPVPGPTAGGPPAMPGMPGMPDMSPDMMQQMLAGMMAQGMDPSNMDPMVFMQSAQAMMGGQPGGGGQQQNFGGQGQNQGFGQAPQGQMGYGGYDQRGNYGGRGRGRRW
ncbi:cleavage polyadenylation factor subunit fip1 [Penicillium pulvis]|uniref:cleavage polyadenylation factor subunit fip1 n=1 Tax=Penicillium pulvis TaxID=1562058 RepID=UPI002546E48A|nr:cleavage polyadenylation factor subunit fip1 [Penicillium pulvis]KAJ5792592.1 cleavage polyadenylation factor subunit fip1 [Penicillium pulvis]